MRNRRDQLCLKTGRKVTGQLVLLSLLLSMPYLGLFRVDVRWAREIDVLHASL